MQPGAFQYHPKMPMDLPPVLLRAAAYGTVAPLRQIQREVGVSTNWTREISDELARHGFLKKRFLPRAGPGRPTAGYELTPAGEKLLDAYREADAMKFQDNVACAGPVWSLALHGFPFSGQKDAFVRRRGVMLALREVEAPPHVLKNLAILEGTKLPSPEALVVWLLESREERFVLAAPFLARTAVIGWQRLWELAVQRGSQGRLAYALWATDQTDKIPGDFPLTGPAEPLVAFGSVEATAESARYHVTQAVPKKRFQEFGRLYQRR